jgi:hypothetical protein
MGSSWNYITKTSKEKSDKIKEIEEIYS